MTREKRRFYIEVGAHNGIFQSQTILKERSGEWDGMLIEPNSKLLKECMASRNKKSNIFINKCLVSKQHKEKTVKFFTYDDCGAAGRIDKFFIGEKPRGTRIIAEAITIDDLLDEHGINNIDFFSIDVEGAELDILSSINFKRKNYIELLVEIHHNQEKTINEIVKKYSPIFSIERLESNNQVHLNLKKRPVEGFLQKIFKHLNNMELTKFGPSQEL